jgi:hypothetical protein
MEIEMAGFFRFFPDGDESSQTRGSRSEAALGYGRSKNPPGVGTGRKRCAFLIPLVLAFHGADALSGEKQAARSAGYRHGYHMGYIAAVRDSFEGASMCTKDVPLAEVIQAIDDYNKTKGLPPGSLSAKDAIEVLSEKYPCAEK